MTKPEILRLIRSDGSLTIAISTKGKASSRIQSIKDLEIAEGLAREGLLSLRSKGVKHHFFGGTTTTFFWEARL